MKVSDVIAGQNLISARRETSLGEIADTMAASRVTGVPIVDEWGVLCGLVTATALGHVMRDSTGLPSDVTWTTSTPSGWWRKLPAEAVMTTDLCTVMHDASLEEAARAMSNRVVHRAIVLGKDRNVMGVISALDFVVLVAEGKLA